MLRFSWLSISWVILDYILHVLIFCLLGNNPVMEYKSLPVFDGQVQIVQFSKHLQYYSHCTVCHPVALGVCLHSNQFAKSVLDHSYACAREGNGNPLQYSCLENPMDGWRSLVGYSPWGRKESDKNERLHFHFFSLYECAARGAVILAVKHPYMRFLS